MISHEKAKDFYSVPNFGGHSHMIAKQLGFDLEHLCQKLRAIMSCCVRVPEEISHCQIGIVFRDDVT